MDEKSMFTQLLVARGMHAGGHPAGPVWKIDLSGGYPVVDIYKPVLNAVWVDAHGWRVRVEHWGLEQPKGV